MTTKPEARPQDTLDLAAELDAINLHTQKNAPASRKRIAAILAEHEENCLKIERVRPRARRI